MSLTIKKPRAKFLLAMAILIAATGGAYYAWSRASALLIIRHFVKNAGIPVHVVSASWNARLSELWEGRIRNLKLDLLYKPLNACIALSTKVDFGHRNQHWAIHLEPELKIDPLPQAKGRIDLELDLDGQFQADIDLKEMKPVQFTFADAKRVSIGAFHVFAQAQNQGVRLKVDVSDAAFESKAMTAKAQRLGLSGEANWPAQPPLPFVFSGKLALSSIQFMTDQILALEPRLDADLGFQFDGRLFKDVFISLDDKQAPLTASLKGDLRLPEKNTQLKAKGSARIEGDLSKIVDKRLASWLEPIVPILRRAKAKGRVEASAKFSFDQKNNFRLDEGIVKLNAKSLELPSRDLFLEGIDLSLPLQYPAEPDWGRVHAGLIEFHSVKLKNIGLLARLWRDGLDLTSEDDNGDDKPLRQDLWGGAIDIAKLYLHIGESFDATAAVKGGPFKLSAMQSDLCLMPSRPLSGDIRFDYPQVVHEKNSTRLVGETKASLFNGEMKIGDVRILAPATGESYPKLGFELRLADLDMQAIGAWSNFGDMRGSLDVSLLNAEFKMTPVGIFPLSYEFTIRGHERGGNKIRFYGRAIDNILSLAGIPRDEFAGMAGIPITMMRAFRNWFPVTAHYAGFRAKADSEWTELSTFDPPPDASTYWCDRKNHYLLCGTGFTIPVNSHGVYPIYMSTVAFQQKLLRSWVDLKGIIKYGKSNDSKNNDAKSSDATKSDGEAECVPPWE